MCMRFDCPTPRALKNRNARAENIGTGVGKFRRDCCWVGLSGPTPSSRERLHGSTLASLLGCWSPLAADSPDVGVIMPKSDMKFKWILCFELSSIEPRNPGVGRMVGTRFRMIPRSIPDPSIPPEFSGQHQRQGRTVDAHRFLKSFIPTPLFMVQPDAA